MIQLYFSDKKTIAFSSKIQCFITKKISKNNLLFRSFLILISLFAFVDSKAQTTFNTGSGTFTVPANVTSVTASAWGGGGGGGGSNSNGNRAGGGGGGGAISQTFATVATNTFSYAVGAGGAGGAANGPLASLTGKDGVDTSITFNPTTTTIIGLFGKGGIGPAGSAGAGGAGGLTTGVGTTSNGVNGVNGNIGSTPGNGGNSGTLAAIFGTGGNGGNGAGNPGGAPGAGGGGGRRNSGANFVGGAGAGGRVFFNYISVSSITNPVCIGSTITITGTNFDSALNTVTINGTACTGVAWVDSTTITAIVASGTTSGTVVVTNTNGTNNGQSITVNAASASMNTGGSATVCTGATTPAFANTTAGGTWSIVNGTGSATISAGGVVTGVTVGTVTVVYTLPSTCSVSSALTVILSPSVATTPNPIDTAIGVCYSGVGSINSVSWATAAGALSYDVYFGAGSLPGIVTANVLTNSYNTGALIANTTYYWKVVAKNSCGGAVGSSTWTFTTRLAPCYCIPSFTSGVYPISNVNFASIINPSSNVVNGATPGYEVFFTPTGTVKQGETYTISVSVNTGGNTTFGVSLFADWNQDGDFLDASETYNIGGINNAVTGTSISGSIVVPIGATIGNTGIRVITRSLAFPISCQSGAFFGQAEDYFIAVTPATCIQPTALSVTAITGTTATFSWTAPTPVPANGYDYHISTSNIPPGAFVPYTGSTAAGVTFINFTGLSTGFTYYLWVRSSCGPGDYSPWVSTSFATPLTNNDCSGAIALFVNPAIPCLSAIDGTTNTATQSLPGCTGTADDDVWYKFVATTTSHIVTVIPSTLNNPIYEIFNACGGASLGCINNSSVSTGVETNTFTTLIPGNTYFVRVYSNGGAGNSGTFTICVTTIPPTFCIPSAAISTRYINDMETVGCITNTTNLNSGRSNTGYGDFTTLAATTQIAGNGINVKLGLVISRQFIKAWVDWDKNGIFDDTVSPTSEIVYTTNGIQTIETTFGFIVPVATPVGVYRMRIRTYENSQTFDPCSNLANGETEDYTISIIPDCTAKITSVFDGSRCDIGTVNLVAMGAGSPTEYRWYTTETGGAYVSTPTGNWTTPSLSATTIYYVTAFNGCESLVRTKVIAEVKATTTILAVPSAPDVCGENNIVSITATNGSVIDDLLNEQFEGTLAPNFTSVRIAGAGDAQTDWQKVTSTFRPNISVWSPAISSRVNGNGFAFTTSDKNIAVNTALESKSLDSRPYSDLTLTFRHYYSYYGIPYDNAIVEVSSNGGTWMPVQTYVSDQALPANFADVTVNLNSYINIADLKIRFRYNARFCDGWAIDDVRVFGTRTLNASFTWTGGVNVYVDALGTIPYIAQLVNTVYVKPNASQLTLPTWSFSVTATLGNGCPLTQNISITNKTKVWQGGTTNWNTAGNWLPVGVPDITNCVIIPSGSTILNTGGAGLGKNLLVKDGGALEIQGANSLTIKENVMVEPTGVFNIKNNSSLVQIDNVVNTGNINMERIATVKKFDYVYWSSPVSGLAGVPSFASSLISPTTSAGYIYKWLPTIGSNSNGWGNWTSGNELMVVGKGYIVRAPDANPIAATAVPTTFAGIPNNGNISIGILRGNYDGAPYSTGVSTTLATKDDDNFNLIGNPYPSAINPSSFLAANTNIAGFVKVWSHGIAISTSPLDPFYNNYSYNYTPGDYITYNSLGSTVGPGVGNIAAGQGFFVLMNHVAATPSTVSFTNTMRRDGSGNVYSNNQFYRNATTNSENSEIEKSRIWLDLIAPNSTNVRTLVGYVDGATNEKDRLFDAYTDEKLSLNFYSVVTDEIMSIQGRAIPFSNIDIVPMGYKSALNGSHTIALVTVDGLFTNQNIFLEDKLMGVVHNMKLAPYNFTTASGTYNDRFVLRYTDNTLGTANFDYNNSVKIFTNNQINITSANKAIKDVVVYNVLGKTLASYKNIKLDKFTISELKAGSSVLIVKVILEDDSIVTQKVIF
jgi:GEVED domain/Ig-like domain CHU_C associated/IPT/TIG domain